MPECDGVVIFEPFEDYGNAPEFTIDDVSGYEILEGDRVRVFTTRQYKGKRELVYTTVMSICCFKRIGAKCNKINDPDIPQWAMREISAIAS